MPRPGTPTGLWRCPKCGARFVTKNLWHSCGRFSLDDLLARCDPPVRALFGRLAAFARRHGGRGGVLVPQKTRAVFMHEVRYCAVYPRKDHLQLGIILRRRFPSRRFFKIEDYYGNAVGHYIRLRTPADLDVELGAWLRESADTYGRKRARPV
jgi:Domain of unknown function (DUF5655)